MQTRHLLSSSISFALLSAALWAPGAAALAQTDDRSQIVAVVQHIIDAFNKGDIAAVKSLCGSDMSVVDEMPPFAWAGPGAMDAWLGDVAKDAQLNKDTDAVSVLGPPTFIRVEGSRAYAVFPDQFSYKRDGRQIREAAMLTFVLTKTSAGWRAGSVVYTAGAH